MQPASALGHQHAYSGGSHVWAYEQDGPTRWRARPDHPAQPG